MPRGLPPVALVAALILNSAGALAASPVFVSHEELARRLATSKVLAPPAGGPIDIDRLEQARARAVADPVAGERALRDLVVALSSEKAPDAGLRGAIEALARYVPRAWTTPADPDHARGSRVPVADVAAAARATLRAWEVAARAQALSSAWRRGAGIAAPMDADAAAAALASLDDAGLDAVLDAGSGRLPVEAMAAVAGRTRHEAASRRVLAEGRGPASLAFVSGIAERLPPAAALDDLRLAARNPALATAACRGLAALVPREPAARDALFALLADPLAGPPAAQALAARDDAGTLARLDDALERAARASAGRDAPSLETRRLLLILQRLPDSDGAPRLVRFVDDARQSPGLRREAAGWVRR